MPNRLKRDVIAADTIETLAKKCAGQRTANENLTGAADVVHKDAMDQKTGFTLASTVFDDTNLDKDEAKASEIKVGSIVMNVKELDEMSQAAEDSMELETDVLASDACFPLLAILLSFITLLTFTFTIVEIAIQTNLIVV